MKSRGEPLTFQDTEKKKYKPRERRRGELGQHFLVAQRRQSSTKESFKDEAKSRRRGMAAGRLANGAQRTA